MKKASLVIGDSFYNNNRLFDLSDPISNRDNCLYPFALLKEKMADNGYDLSTADINEPECSEIVLYNEMPKSLPELGQKTKSYLMIFESELIRPDNWIVNNHKAFQRVFTWHDDYVGRENYSKINFSFEIPLSISKEITKKNKLCTLIAGNKKIQHPKELYSKRVDVIRWFEKNYPQDFDLYGIGWDRYRFSGPIWMRALNKVSFITKLLSLNFPSYRGKVDTKIDTLEKYRFAICYENAYDIPGYITEKIFDCLFAGCIPVYWGANNIEAYIPRDCYIDMRDFHSYEALYSYLVSMSDEAYLRRLGSIESYIQSDLIKQFSSEMFVQTILSHTVNQ
jgi:hypothetical protein